MGQEVKEQQAAQSALQDLAEAEAPKFQIEDSPMASFFRGMGRGALGPLLDLYYRATGSEEYVKRQDEMSPIAEGVGHLTGLVGGAVAGGLPGAAGKAGALTLGGAISKAGAATSKAIAPKLGTTLGGRLATSAITGATEGGLAGLAEGSSAAALDREAGMPGIARHVMEGVGYGAAFGSAANVLGTAFFRTNNWLFKKAFDREIKDAAKQRELQLKFNKQLSALEDEINHLDPDSMAAQYRRREILGEPGFDWQGKPLHEAYGTSRKDPIRGHKVYARIDDFGEVSYPELWVAQNGLENASDKISSLTNKNARRLSSLVGNTAKDLTGVAAASAAGGLVGGPLGAGGGAFIFRSMLPGYFTAIADHLLDGLDKFPMVRQAVARSITAGELTLDKMHIDPVTKQFRRIPAGMIQDPVTGDLIRAKLNKRSVDGIINEALAARKALKVAPLHHMTNEEYNDIVNEFNETDVGQYEMQNRLALMASGVPQEAVNGHIEHQMRVQQYIQSSFPAAMGNKWVTSTGDVLRSTDAQRIALARRLRAAMLPETVISDFLSDKLTPEAAEAFWATVPDLAGVLSNEVSKLVEVSASHGIKFTPKRRQQVALLLNQPTKTGRQYDPVLIQMLQENYISERPNVPMPKGGSGTNISGVSQQNLAGSQAIAARLNGMR